MQRTFDRGAAPSSGVVACGLWLRVGFLGASVLAIGLISLLSGELDPVTALAIVLAGGALAVFAWRRARMAIEDNDGSVAEVRTGTSPVVGHRVDRVTSNASHG